MKTESDKITSEMEDAGIDAFFRIDCVEDSPQEIVRDIYQAMCGAVLKAEALGH